MNDLYIDFASAPYIGFHSDLRRLMCQMSERALRISAQLNAGYHEPSEVRALFSDLTGREVDESFRLFTPFYTDFGRNIIVGKNVFINMGCKFQDQGGIFVGDGTFIGHNCVIATLNHCENPAHRGNMIARPVHIGRDVWIGANVTILGGVSIGDGAIIGAGAVVTHDVPANSVAMGVPARVVRKVKMDEKFGANSEVNLSENLGKNSA